MVNRSFYLVDLPGYGCAKVSKRLQAEWGRELEGYISDEQRLAGVVSLMDIRHGPTRLDLDLIELLNASGRQRLVVLTKSDKVGRGQRARMQNEVQRQLGLATRPMAVSVRSGEGRRELMRSIGDLATEWRVMQRGE
jgi:GTP-binding protein